MGEKLKNKKKLWTESEVIKLIEKHSEYIDEKIDYHSILNAPVSIPCPEWDDKAFIKKNL